MSTSVELLTVSRLGCGQRVESSPTQNPKSIKSNIRTFPVLAKTLHCVQTNRLGSPIKSSQQSTTTNESKMVHETLHRQETNLAHLVGTNRFRNAVAKAQGSRLETGNNEYLLKPVVHKSDLLRRTVSCLPSRRESTVTESDYRPKSVSVAEPSTKPKKTISLQFSSNKQQTYKDVIIQLFRIWEPQLSASYRPFVKYVPVVEDEDGQSYLSDTLGSSHDPFRSMKTAGTAIEAVNRFNKKAIFINK